MYCIQCGAELPDGARYCPVCGTQAGAAAPAGHGQRPAGAEQKGGEDLAQKIIETVSKTAENTAEQQKAQEKAVRGRWLLWVCAGVLAAAILLVIGLQAAGGRNTDYITSVKKWAPFAKNYEIAETVGDVFGRYMPDAVWTQDGEENGASVVAEGSLTGLPYAARAVFRVELTDEQSGEFSLASFTMDGVGLAEPDVVLEALFYAYGEDWKDLAEFAETG